MIKTNNNPEPLEIKNESVLRNMTIGYNEHDFVMAINKQENDSYEGVYTVPVEKLKEIVETLFNAGVIYQRDNKKDIGFKIAGDDNE